MELKTGFVCDRGLNPRRPVNQDRYLVDEARGLFAVFDGVGGQHAGEVASQTAADTIEEAAMVDYSISPPELLRRAIQFANRDIYEMASGNPAYSTMATTVAVLQISGQSATIAHVGDSRVYRLRGRDLVRETIDHTDLDDQLRAGLITPEQAAKILESHIINRALGAAPDVEVEVKTVDLLEGDRFLICTDGVYRMLSEDEITGVLVDIRDPQKAADQLKHLIHERGADDNLTAVVVQGEWASRLSPDNGALRTGSNSPGAVKPRGRTNGSRSDVKPEPAGDTSPNAADAPGHAGTFRDHDDRIRVVIRDSEKGNPGSRAPGSTGHVLSEPRAQRVNIAEPEAIADSDGKKKSVIVMYGLLVLVLIVGAFYAGLRVGGSLSKRPAAAGSTPGLVSADTIEAGRQALELGDYQTAQRTFEGLANREPQNALALYWLGRVHLGERRYQDAISDFDKALALSPALRDAYVQSAAAYESAGNRAKALEMLARYAESSREPRPATK